MTNVLGMELSAAEQLLTAEGYTVTAEEIRSRKGVEGGSDKRVIRVRRAGTGNTVCLAYSVFNTAVSLENELDGDRG